MVSDSRIDPNEPLSIRAKRIFPVHKDRCIIVTGAAAGIGKATVEQLVSEGARVAAWDINIAGVQELATAHEPGKVLPVICDLGQQASIEVAFKATEAALGHVDGVVNNGGITRRSNALDASWDDWQACMSINVFGSFEVARLAARSMIEKGIRGAIVNMASEAGKKGGPQSIAYGASKAAVINMTRILSTVLAPNDINVNCVCPGGVGTDMLRGAAKNFARIHGEDPDQVYGRFVSSQIRRHITSEEVAATISFLLSDAALIIRGQAVNADGGDTPY